MNTEASPRPWRVVYDIDGNDNNQIVDANGKDVVSFYDWEGNLSKDNADLIVDAVNERDRLRDIVRRMCDTAYQVRLIDWAEAYEDAKIGEPTKNEAWLLQKRTEHELIQESQSLIGEARAALGEDKK